MIAIIGAGISGLSVGYYLQQNGIDDFIIFEKEAQVGGKIQTTKFDSYFLEHGPNTLLTTPLVEQLIAALGLETLVPDLQITQNRYLSTNGRPTLLPTSPQKLLFSSILSLKAKISIIKDLRFKPIDVPENQTVSAFFELHFCKEIVEKLVKTFCRGIYASDADHLLIKTCFPALADYQQKYGSIIKGLKANQSIEKRKVITFKQGMKTLVDALETKVKEKINPIEINTIEYQKGEFILNKTLHFDQLILANDAQNFPQLLGDILPKSALLSKKIEYACLDVVHSVYQVAAHPLKAKGFGVLFPPKESKNILGHIWNSSIIPNLDPEKTILTAMVLDQNKCNDELDNYFAQNYDLHKKDLLSRTSVHWQAGIPIYNKAHLAFVQQFDKENKLKLYICSNVRDGVSIPDRILESKELANRLKQ